MPLKILRPTIPCGRPCHATGTNNAFRSEGIIGACTFLKNFTDLTGGCVPHHRQLTNPIFPFPLLSSTLDQQSSVPRAAAAK